MNKKKTTKTTTKTPKRTTTTNSKTVRTVNKRKINGQMPAVVSGKRKKKRKKKVSFTGDPLMDTILGVIVGTGGAIAFNKFVPMEDKKMKDALMTLLGGATIFFGAKQKNNFLKAAGVSVTAVGGVNLAKDFGVMQGMTDFMAGIGVIDDDEDVMFIEMGTLTQQNPMAGPPQQLPVVSGGMTDEADAINVMGNSDMPRVVSGPY